jgi:hypothetical protein
VSKGYHKAVELLRTCSSRHGFVASAIDRDNYHRVWSRDGAIMGLAALQTRDEDLIRTFRKTLETLIEYQGPHGEIPSNVNVDRGIVSYGGTAGRVDADLWFGIGVGQYVRATDDSSILESAAPALERVRFLLGAWEFNNRGLLYVPQTGDWSDEYIQNGYVLYDQLLYLQFQREVEAINRMLGRHTGFEQLEKRRQLKRLIRANFWFDTDGEPSDDIYHDVLFTKGSRAARVCAGKQWMPFFSPLGYGYRFDSFANVLASLLGVAVPDQSKRVDRRINEDIVGDGVALLPAFYPVITPWDQDWEDLQTMFSYTFKNDPYEFHNGGLWPMVTGFYVADLARRGREDDAVRFVEGIDWANARGGERGAWSFPEYIHGKDFTAGGTRRQGWSAAASIIGHKALEGEPVIRGTEDEDEEDPPVQ